MPFNQIAVLMNSPTNETEMCMKDTTYQINMALIKS